ncbi:amidase [Pseudonocardia sp. TRM90224]|uniref:amidase n=1 Tax=Pseudonocardia sp. TRM90224 TaxID=2812678 RepID=UPI001E4AC2A9|nr:amidase [Pseudonocardia sp. TRM90224]
MADLHDLGIDELARLLGMGAVSPVELSTHLADRVEAMDPAINAFVHWDRRPALAQARAAHERRRAGRPRGPLDGVPVAIKDNITTADQPTTAGSAARLPVPEGDAAVVAALRAAGVVIFGKTNLPELAYGPVDSYVFGPTRNPWDPHRYAGGSSMGAGAAVAAGFVPGAVGTDTTGSVRNPANWCGVVGLKPTRGRIPLDGVIPLSRSLDHVGLLTRSARDCRLLLPAAEGWPVAPMPGAPRPGPGRLRIGLLRTAILAGLPDAVQAAVAAAVEEWQALGATVVDCPVPGWGAAAAAAEVVVAREAAVRYRPLIDADPDSIGVGLRGRLEAAAAVSGQAYVDARRVAAAFDAELEAATRGVDLLVLPGRERAAPRMDVAGRVLDAPVGVRCVAPLNVVGWPALAVPCGVDPDGLPLGVQIVARPGVDELLLQAAEALQEVTGWHLRRPPL